MTVSPTIRPYVTSDRAACLALALFGSNCPEHFHTSERAGYEQFLADPGVYFVLERPGAALPGIRTSEIQAPEIRMPEIIGCGGVWLGGELPEGAAGLSWGMVRRDLRGQGMGTRLTEFRLAWIRQHRPQLREVHINTTQHSRSYYLRHDFRVRSVRADGFAPGFDDMLMVLSL